MIWIGFELFIGDYKIELNADSILISSVRTALLKISLSMGFLNLINCTFLIIEEWRMFEVVLHFVKHYIGSYESIMLFCVGGLW